MADTDQLPADIQDPPPSDAQPPGLMWRGSDPTPILLDPRTGQPISGGPGVTMPAQLAGGRYFSQTLPPGWKPPQAPPPDPMAQLAAMQQAASNLPLKEAAASTAAAERLIAMRGYQADLAAGTPAAEAMAKWGPMLFNQGRGADMGAAMKAMQPGPKLQMTPVPGGGQALTYGNTLRVTQPPGGMTPSQQANLQIAKQRLQMAQQAAAQRTAQANAARALRGAQVGIKTLESGPYGAYLIKGSAPKDETLKAGYAKAKAQYDKYQQMLQGDSDQAQEGDGSWGSGAPTSTAAAPLPKSPADRVKGKTYRLPKGLFTWTGTGWVEPDDTANAD
jgi:hypothetical protein